MSSVTEILEKARLTPLLSPSALTLMKLVATQTHSLQDVLHIAECDTALTANVLKVVNAPAFGLGRPVTSLARAVSFLGDKMVVGIAIGSCSQGVFSTPLRGYDSRAGELWLHSLRTAIAAREISGYATLPMSAETAFTAGILHDIGKSLISDYLTDRTPELLAALDSDEAIDFLAAERQLLGVDHCEVGAALAEHWSLPGELVTAIRLHHAPSAAEASRQPVTFAVHLGDIVAMLGGSSTGADALAYGLDPGFEAHFHLSPTDMENLLLTVSTQFERTKTLFFS